jgi:hypothetical protein
MTDNRSSTVVEKAAFALVAASILFIFAALANYFWYMASDDAFISFRYAERFAEGKGLTWNDDMRVEGYSNPLWVFILAAAKVAGCDLLAAAKFLGIVFAAATLFMLYLLSATATKKWTSPLNLAAPFILAVNADFHYWTPSGLETALFAFLSTLALYLFIRERAAPDSTPVSALVFFLAAITRPEGVVLFAGAFVYVVVSKARYGFRGEKGTPARREMFWLLLFAALYIGFLAFRIAYYGKLFPNPFYAKLGGASDLSHGAAYVGVFLSECAPLLILAPLALLTAGAGPRIAVAAFALFIPYAAALIYMGGDWMNNWRLWCNILPLIALIISFAFAGAISLLCAIPAGRKSRNVSIIIFVACFILAVVFLFGPGIGGLANAFSFKRLPVIYAQEVDYTYVAGREIGEYLRENAPAGASVAVNHAGAIPYYSKLKAIDMTGLNDSYIASIRGKGLHQKYDADYVLSERPDFIVLNTHSKVLPFGIVPNYWEGETAIFNHPWFKKNYEMIDRVWSVNWLPPKEHYVVIYRRIAE